MAEVSGEEWDTWHSFFLMRRQLDRALEQQLQRHSDVSAADYEILVALSQAPGKQLRARTISEMIGWEKSRVSHQVSRMEKRGLVERRECESDARGVWIVITNEGRRAVLAAMRHHSAAIRRYFFDVLSPEEQRVLKGVSARVLAAIDPPLSEPMPSQLSAALTGKA